MEERTILIQQRMKQMQTQRSSGYAGKTLGSTLIAHLFPSALWREQLLNLIIFNQFDYASLLKQIKKLNSGEMRWMVPRVWGNYMV